MEGFLLILHHMELKKQTSDTLVIVLCVLVGLLVLWQIYDIFRVNAYLRNVLELYSLYILPTLQ